MLRWLRGLALAVIALAGLVLLAGAGYTLYAVQEIEARYPPSGQWVETRLGRQHYLAAGSADARETAVLLHGASSNLREFEHSLMPALRERYRVLAFDRPGYGYSERDSNRWASPKVQARLLHEALTTLGIKRPILVAHSWSGALVLAYALDYPQDTRAVVLLGGATHPWSGGVAWHITLAQLPVIGPLFTRTVFLPVARATATNALAYIYNPEPVPELLASDIGLALSLRPAAYSTSAADVARLSEFLQTQRERYAALRVPMLFVSGTDDQVVPAWNHAHRFKQHPAARVIDLPNVGHGLHRTQTPRIADLIDRFVAELPAPAPR